MLEYKSIFISPIFFCFLSKKDPGEYYFGKCSLLLNKILDNDFYKLLELIEGAGGKKNSGFRGKTYQYTEDLIEKNLFLLVSYEENEIEIKIVYEKSNIIQGFIENIELNIKERFLKEQTIYSKIIKTNRKDIEDIFYIKKKK